MQAIILAAGMGKRLKALTKENTKCMVKVNGVTLIERMLTQIDSQRLSKITIVTGYEGQKLKDFVAGLKIDTPIEYIDNPIYDKTNNIYSLYLARELMIEEDTILFESDLIFEDAILDELIADPRGDLVLVDKYESWMDGTCVKLSEDETIASFIPGKFFDYDDVDEYYKTINIYKFSREFSEKYYVPFLEAYQRALGQNEYYEQVLRVITMLDNPMLKAKILPGGLKWYEIDDIQDLDIAESIFIPDEDAKVYLMQSRYGGYWRYPGLLDYSYLVNPFFPTDRMKDEMRANFDGLMMQYPSGLRVNSLLAAKNFGVGVENIVTGNGAAELIKSLLSIIDGRMGYITPTFEEYKNRYASELSVEFRPNNRDFAYTADDVIRFFDSKEIENLVIINPDNPSGNYINKEDMLSIVKWSQSKNIRLVVDESFIDFAEEQNSSLIDQAILDKYPNLYAIKSISKSYGVPGLRLGVLASGDRSLISAIKADVSIWNINSHAEFFMQIWEKYKQDYSKALFKFREERKRFINELSKLSGIRVIPTQANFVMIEVKDGMYAANLLKNLLIHHDILIKDLSFKVEGQGYMRIAVRNASDNDILIKAMKEEINRLG